MVALYDLFCLITSFFLDDLFQIPYLGYTYFFLLAIHPAGWQCGEDLGQVFQYLE
jgi:hypothetical protein